MVDVILLNNLSIVTNMFLDTKITAKKKDKKKKEEERNECLVTEGIPNVFSISKTKNHGNTKSHKNVVDFWGINLSFF